MFILVLLVIHYIVMRTNTVFNAICLMIAIFLSTVSTLDNGLGLTPPMGWNSWNKYGCNINQSLIRKTADLLVSTGLAFKGYQYVNLDDCWQASRNGTTKVIIQDPAKFPNGIKGLADYVHSKGLKFGLYSDAGEKTCEGRPGSYGYEKIDAKTYAEWGVDYLKYDNCYNLNISSKLRYFAMHKALNQSGRHIFYSMCNWGQDNSWEWAGPYANSWRTTGDIQDNWKSMLSIIDQQVELESYAGPGGWNDPDMLEVGNGGMTHDEYTAHFAMWAVLKAPLLIGCSLQNMDSSILSILGNEQLIAINQDPLGVQASRVRRDVTTQGTYEIWSGELSNNRQVIVFFNRGEQAKQIKVNIVLQMKLIFDNYSLRDVIRHKDLGIKVNSIITAYVEKHSVEVFVLKLYKSKLEQLQDQALMKKQRQQKLIIEASKKVQIAQNLQQTEKTLQHEIQAKKTHEQKQQAAQIQKQQIQQDNQEIKKPKQPQTSIQSGRKVSKHIVPDAVLNPFASPQLPPAPNPSAQIPAALSEAIKKSMSKTKPKPKSKSKHQKNKKQSKAKPGNKQIVPVGQNQIFLGQTVIENGLNIKLNNDQKINLLDNVQREPENQATNLQKENDK